MVRILNRCPICGQKLTYEELMQYSNIYSIKNNGELSKNIIKKEDIGSMECGYIVCANQECNFMTDANMNSEIYPNIKIWQEKNAFYYKNINEE